MLDVSTEQVEAFGAEHGGGADSMVERAALGGAIYKELEDMGHPRPWEAMRDFPLQTRAPALSLNGALDAGADGGGS